MTCPSALQSAYSAASMPRMPVFSLLLSLLIFFSPAEMRWELWLFSFAQRRCAGNCGFFPLPSGDALGTGAFFPLPSGDALGTGAFFLCPAEMRWELGLFSFAQRRCAGNGCFFSFAQRRCAGNGCFFFPCSPCYSVQLNPLFILSEMKRSW